MTASPDLVMLASTLPALTDAAGTAIMAVYASAFASRVKDDDSPVTDADEAAEAIILTGLARLAPDIPVIAEEQAARGASPAIGGRYFWLVDPLDGTREFIDRNGDFTVNIALIMDGHPVLGIVAAPALALTWLGWSGGGAWRMAGADPPQPVSARPAPASGCRVLVSRHHREAQVQDWLDARPGCETLVVGSSLKFCRIAEGAADFYPRFGSIAEWDTAAGQAVLEAAGGAVLTWENAPLAYGKPGFRNPGFLARGRV